MITKLLKPRLKTFSMGGMHVPDNKLSDKEAIKHIPLPAEVQVPFAQHLGSPSEPIVKRGDKILTGQLIAKSTGPISANIHSPVTGTVLKMGKFLDVSGYKKPSIVIKVEPDKWVETVNTDESIITEITMEKDHILERIKQCGIVGLGGATFPSHAKFGGGSKKAELLLVNGVECEPYLTADHRLMLEKSDQIVVGINILKKALDVKEVVIGIENNKKDAVAIMRKAAKPYDYIKVVALQVKYPQGGEKQLIKAAINKEVPSGKFPIDIGAVVFNVGTVYAIYQAVQKNKPLIERVVTVTGKSLERPSNFWVRIGTPVQHLLDQVGGIPDDTGKIINGGPMMGKAMKDFNVPVTKGTSGILILQHDCSNRKDAMPCIRCSKCIDVCPMGLEPYLLMTLTEKLQFERLEHDNVLDCIECGSCSYICPSGRPLLDYIRWGKTAVRKMKTKQN
jgi:electron transport complex protein RnfC